MSLPRGYRLGPYEIVAPLGAGGMGEVYEARDTRLDRTVAIKVLHAHLSANPERRQRLEREARTISQLNHPHICTLYDVGQQDGVDFLVMEYLQGETLAERIRRGALPLGQVLQHAIEIADALDKAHHHGVVHRDLKPRNIMLTASGVKLLDFGLAKVGQPVVASSPSTTIARENVSLTSAGAVIGTFPYMAPEQVEGKTSDARTDIFAFGAVVYEMVTGRRAFAAETQAGLVAAVLVQEPPSLLEVEPAAPAALGHLVHRCLAKDPEDRWQSARDLVHEIRWISEDRPTPPVGRAAGGLRRRERLVWIAATSLLLSAIAIVYVLRGAPSGRGQTMRFLISKPEPVPEHHGGLALAPDGTRLVYPAPDKYGQKRLWIRSLASVGAQPLVGTEDGEMPFWSPDGRFVAFFAGGKLKKLDLSNGGVQMICDAPFGRGGTWNRDGTILFAPLAFAGIHRVAASGGEATPVTAGENRHRWPHFLPDGRRFLYVDYSTDPDKQGIYLGSLESGERRRLLPDLSNAVYEPPRFLLFVRGGRLMAQPFDLEKAEPKGEPVPIAERVASSDIVDHYGFSASANGTLAFQFLGEPDRQLGWFDRRGHQLAVLGKPGFFHDPNLSPDGRRVAVALDDEINIRGDIWILDAERGSGWRCTSGGQACYTPIWAPDGNRIAFTRSRSGEYALIVKHVARGGEEVLLQSRTTVFPSGWSRNGEWILYQYFATATEYDIWRLLLDGTRKTQPVLQTEFWEGDAQLSPDERWFAYTSYETGRQEVHVRTVGVEGEKWPVSSGGGSQPRWRRDGKEIFYIAPDRNLMAADVGAGARLTLGPPHALFRTRVFATAQSVQPQYDVSADGQRFLIVASTTEAPWSLIAVILNWTADVPD